LSFRLTVTVPLITQTVKIVKSIFVGIFLADLLVKIVFEWLIDNCRPSKLRKYKKVFVKIRPQKQSSQDVDK